MIELDELDRRILFELGENGNLGLKALSMILKLPTSSIHYRIQRMLKADVFYYTIEVRDGYKKQIIGVTDGK